ncbi:MAG: trigger factor [Candidatus Melainabacteria bacterium RIFCSPHIGHO2_02_FULL_34_12]|nr:MAG: trigger factor [Candidatus Melainabacteria bacterium RIFCSPHIGHO2_02_FULL_34_12]
MTNMKLKIQTNPSKKNNEIEMSVEALPEISDKAYSIAFREIASNVDIQGFRKGKAPKELIEKQVGKGYICQKAFEKIFYDVLLNAAVQEKLEIIDVVEIQSYNLLPGVPFTFKATVELKPEVDLGKYKGLKIKATKYEYDKEAFTQKTLEKIVNNMITYSKTSNRDTVREGDLIVVNFEGKFNDGTEVPGGKAENFQVVLEKDKFLPEFVDQLVGVQIGQTKNVEVTFPENYAQDFSGRKAKFTVNISSLEEKVIPQVNDELAVKLGMKNLNELHSKIAEHMNELEQQNNQKELENKIVDEIINQSKCDLSERMIQKEVDFLLRDIRSQCEKNGITWDSFKKDEKNKDIFQKAHEAAVKRILIDLVLSSIAKKENITASEEDIKNEMKSRITQMGENYKTLENDPGFRNTVELVLLRNKAVDFLIKNNEPVWDSKPVKLNSE